MQFAAQEFVPQVCIAVPLSPGFNSKDAGACAVANECVDVIKAVHQVTGDAFLHHLATSVLPQYGVPAQGAEGFCEQVKAGAATMQLRNTLLALRPPSNCNGNGNGHVLYPSNGGFHR